MPYHQKVRHLKMLIASLLGFIILHLMVGHKQRNLMPDGLNSPDLYEENFITDHADSAFVLANDSYYLFFTVVN